MLQASTIYQSAIKEAQRQFQLKMMVNGEIEIDGQYIKVITIKEQGNSGDTITIGDVCSNAIEIEMFNTPTPLLLDNGYVTVYSGLVLDEEVEWVILGTYYITSITSDDHYKTLKIEGYDAMQLLNIEYIPTISFDENTTLQDVVEDIAKVSKVSLATMDLPIVLINGYMEGSSCQEMLGYMAGLLGKNAKINRNNEIEFYWYTETNEIIDSAIQYQNGLKMITEKDIVIHSLTSGTEDNVLVSGSGYGITFTNPYITQEQLDNIYESIKGLTYTPCEILWRGNPTIEIGDIVTIEAQSSQASKVLVMENTLVLSGGINSTIISKGQSEAEESVSKSPSDIKLNKLYNTLTTALKDNTETILGHNGGYYNVDTDEETGYPTGWTIMNTPTLEDHTCLWKWTAGGFGYSEDGGKTFTNIAIDMEGRISATAITTGLLQGENFVLDLEKGSITMGARDETGEFTTTWFTVDTSGLHMSAMEQIQEDISDVSTVVDTMNTSLAITQGNIEQIIEDTTVIINGEETTTKEAYSYMKQQIDAITFAISESGGNNKLLNSAGWNATNFWEVTEKTVAYNLLRNSMGLTEDFSEYPFMSPTIIKDTSIVEGTISRSAFDVYSPLMRYINIGESGEYILSFCAKSEVVGIQIGALIMDMQTSNIIIENAITLTENYMYYEIPITLSDYGKDKYVLGMTYMDQPGHIYVSDLYLVKTEDYIGPTWQPHQEEGVMKPKQPKITSYTNMDIRSNTVSGYAFEIKDGAIRQTVKTIIGNSYNVSCKIKKGLATCYLKIINESDEIYVFRLQNDYVDNWVSFNVPFVAKTMEAIIEVGSDAEVLLISDIMVNDGEIPQQWSSSNDEIYTTNVKIDKTGITISQDQTENKTVINTVEFAGYEKDKRVFTLNGDTTEVNRLVADSDVQIGVVKAYAKTEGSKMGLGFAYIKK